MKILSDQRRTLIFGLASAPMLASCGGRGGDDPAQPSLLSATADRETTVVLDEQADSSTLATFWRPEGAPVQLRSVQFREGARGGNLYLDERGRPTLLEDAATGALTQVLHSDDNRAVMAQQDADGTVVAVQVFWLDGDRYFTGAAQSLDAVLPADLSDVRDITDAVAAKRAELLSIRMSSPSILFRLLPISSARAQESGDETRAAAIAFIAEIFSTVWPALVVFQVALIAGSSPWVVAAATLLATVLLLTRTARAASARSRERELLERYVALPFTGTATLRGRIRIPASDTPGSPCSGTLLVAGTVRFSIGTGLNGRASISGTEFIRTPCLDFVFAKSENIARLTRSGNLFSGQSGSPTNPFVFSLTVNPELTVASGTVTYPYAFGGLSGFASADVVLRR